LWAFWRDGGAEMFKWKEKRNEREKLADDVLVRAGTRSRGLDEADWL
jgi:hypothetical protein